MVKAVEGAFQGCTSAKNLRIGVLKQAVGSEIALNNSRNKMRVQK